MSMTSITPMTSMTWDDDAIPNLEGREDTPIRSRKFVDPDFTADGQPRAKVALDVLETLWINTGSLCNISCVNCYIESTPLNDRLSYFSLADAIALFDEIAALGVPTREIGFTGGEPFLNPEFPAMAEEALRRGFNALILTNAMRPMQRPSAMEALRRMRNDGSERLTVRVSLDHYSKALHEEERGPKTWDAALSGLDRLADEKIRVHVCGRTMWNESEESLREGYAKLFTQRGWNINANDPIALMLLPEMDAQADVPEITNACWKILGVDPSSPMCARSRMAVKRRGRDAPSILPCTLIPYDERFEMGKSLAESFRADGDTFANGAVKLNHPHCSRFCVLGGGTCSAKTET